MGSAPSPASGSVVAVSLRVCCATMAAAFRPNPGQHHAQTNPPLPATTNGKVERFNRTLGEEWAYSRLYLGKCPQRARPALPGIRPDPGAGPETWRDARADLADREPRHRRGRDPPRALANWRPLGAWRDQPIGFAEELDGHRQAVDVLLPSERRLIFEAGLLQVVLQRPVGLSALISSASA